jgi:hypothetical protein
VLRSGTGQDHSVPHIPLSYNHSASGSSSSGSNRSGRGRSGLPSGPGFQVDFTANFTVDPFTFRHATALPDRAIKFMTMTPHTALPLITHCALNHPAPHTSHYHLLILLILAAALYNLQGSDAQKDSTNTPGSPPPILLVLISGDWYVPCAAVARMLWCYMAIL